MQPSVHAVAATSSVPYAPYREQAPVPLAPADLRTEVPLDQVRFVPASGALLRRIAHLREEIALPQQVRAAPAFARLEKKETSRGWSVRSSAWAPSSGPSASCR